MLHSIVSTGKQHDDGEVPTDLELARIVAILAKCFCGNVKSDEYICDPAAGSGNLITSAVDVFNVSPCQIKANDVNEKLLELLSLRTGLNFAKIVNNKNSAEISAKSIVDLPTNYFDKVKVIVMNPPFIAGIKCVERKQELFKKIREIKRKNAITNIGQMNLEGAFLEAICSLCKPDTVISCVLPKTHLVARGAEAVALRKYLLTDFGLTAIFSYPEEGLFDEVVKGTCVVVGKVGASSDTVKIISSNGLVADIDLQSFEKAISGVFNTETFATVTPGIDGIEQTKKHLLSIVKEGWRQVCREFDDALGFQEAHIRYNDKLIKMKDIDKKLLVRKRGVAGNSGASDLLMMDRVKPFYQKYKGMPVIPAVRNAKLGGIIISDGDTTCFDVAKINDSDLEKIANDFSAIPLKESRQQRNEKTPAELIALLKSTSSKATPANSVLIPRGIRSQGRAYVTEKNAVISTNLISVTEKNKVEAFILASWISTIFYQLICEVNAKPQEGMRKMEVGDIEETYIPVVDMLTKEQIKILVTEIGSIEFLRLNTPVIRKIDMIWADILFGKEARLRLDEAKRLLEFLANARNPLSNNDD